MIEKNYHSCGKISAGDEICGDTYTCYECMSAARQERTEEAVNKTIEDLKAVFRYSLPNKTSKSKVLYIPEKKLGTLRYFLLKNLKEAHRND